MAILRLTEHFLRMLWVYTEWACFTIMITNSGVGIKEDNERS